MLVIRNRSLLLGLKQRITKEVKERVKNTKIYGNYFD